MKTDEKIAFVDEVMGFMMDESVRESAKLFPSPADHIESRFLTATIFRNVRDRQNIPQEHWEAPETFIADAEPEYRAAEVLDEPPDTEEELGVGYDGYDIPEDFAERYQTVIREEVIAVLSTDRRPRGLSVVAEERRQRARLCVNPKRRLFLQ